MILIAYDGADDAKAAIEHVARLFPGERAPVLTVWQRFIDTLARVGAGLSMVLDCDESPTTGSSTPTCRARAEHRANLR
jgi:hypothetical protein